MNLYQAERKRSDGTLVCTLWTHARHLTEAIDFLIGEQVYPAYFLKRIFDRRSVWTIRDETKTSDYWEITMPEQPW